MRAALALSAIVLVASLAGCKREQRKFRESTPLTNPSQGVSMSGLHPAQPTRGTHPSPSEKNSGGMYGDNAYGVAEGQKLYNAYNCVGCHANGGGGIGPPLMDANWIYGSEPQNVYLSIVQGRPNGMPSFRGKIPDQQVWEIVAYVRSLSGQLRKDVAPGRSDDMSIHKAPESTPRETPHGPTGVQKK